jgi:hypothetical protein
VGVLPLQQDDRRQDLRHCSVAYEKNATCTLLEFLSSLLVLDCVGRDYAKIVRRCDETQVSQFWSLQSGFRNLYLSYHLVGDDAPNSSLDLLAYEGSQTSNSDAYIVPIYGSYNKQLLGSN